MSIKPATENGKIHELITHTLPRAGAFRPTRGLSSLAGADLRLPGRGWAAARPGSHTTFTLDPAAVTAVAATGRMRS